MGRRALRTWPPSLASLREICRYAAPVAAAVSASLEKPTWLVLVLGLVIGVGLGLGFGFRFGFRFGYRDRYGRDRWPGGRRGHQRAEAGGVVDAVVAAGPVLMGGEGGW